MRAATTSRAVPLGTLLRLGRVSNLPTVWTNALAATVIAGGDPFGSRTALALAAMTLFYVGGMYLNDAFDRGIDARERPGRPIPAGEIAAASVFGIGFGLLGAGVVLMALCGAPALVAGLALSAVIVLYDMRHKGNPLSPVVMSLCRLLVYVGAAAATVGAVPAAVWIAGLAMAAHVAGLTYAAKQEALDRVERLWPLAVLVLPLIVGAAAIPGHWWAAAFWLALAAADWLAVDKLRRRAAPGAVPAAVAALIAAISLVDALMVAPVSPAAAVLCVAGYAATRLAQRIVPGT
jgi:4-hydroxybenzoate polyprenyltransferase